jgi:hypothetical protein
MEETDLIQTSSANTEIAALTNKLEEPPTQPMPNVNTFSDRLDSLLKNLEESRVAKRDTPLHSFTNQPERVNISSDSDINVTQSADALDEQNFNSFRVAIPRPFLDVKSIQLLRASIPNAVTNIPDEECVFWYYRFPISTFSGTISISIPGVAGYSNATFTTAGVITPALSTGSISFAIPGNPIPGNVNYVTGAITGLAAGTALTISGITPAGYSGTFNVIQVNPPNAFNVANATTGTASYSSAMWSLSITDFINWGTVPYSVCSSTGVIRGYFQPPSTNPGTVSIYSSADLSGATIGTITRSSDLFMPGPSPPTPATLAENLKYLHMIRLLPSYYKSELFSDGANSNQNLFGNYGVNRTFTDYEDLASELAVSCAHDPMYDARVAQLGVFPTFIPNDISITYNPTSNKFYFTGNNIIANGVRYAAYLSAGYNDENLWVNTSPTNPYLVSYNAPQLYVESGIDNGDFVYVYGIKGQPYKKYRTLNQRLGFNWNGSIEKVAQYFPINYTAITSNPGGSIYQQGISVIASYFNRLRSVPPLQASIATAGSGAYTSDNYTADSYANLVYTNTVSLYADFTGGSTYDSIGNTQLLACVPMNASNLGVTFYNTTLYCPLTKISDQIYEIEIRMLTDTGAPYNIPNSAIVSLELALTY